MRCSIATPSGSTQLKPRVLVGQFAGAAGTLASLGDKGFEVQQALCEELALGVPVSTWHVARDGLAEAMNFLALVTGSLGKVALDIMMMASTEFGEVYEPFVKGRGASSTMPQKRNPISSELMLAAAKGVRQHAGLMLDAMVQDFERATGPWHAEWMAIPESFVLTAGSLHQAKFALGGLIVDEKKMAENLDISRGLIVAEAVMMGLAPDLGRQEAHDVVYDACRVANDKGMTLADALSADSRVSARIDRATIERLTSPRNYLGLAPKWWTACSRPRSAESIIRRGEAVRARVAGVSPQGLLKDIVKLPHVQLSPPDETFVKYLHRPRSRSLTFSRRDTATRRDRQRCTITSSKSAEPAHEAQEHFSAHPRSASPFPTPRRDTRAAPLSPFECPASAGSFRELRA